jgi:hypothetical protein
MSPEDNDAEDREFEKRARSELRREIDATPAELRTQLDRAVDTALRAPRRSYGLHFALPAAAVALVAGLFVAQQMRQPAAPPSPASDDLALLLNVDLDLLEQMEFYQWLDRQPGVLDEALAAPEDEAQRS